MLHDRLMVDKRTVEKRSIFGTLWFVVIDTRVIMKVADEWDQSTEITASQFITNINETYPRGFSFHMSDTEVRFLS